MRAPTLQSLLSATTIAAIAAACSSSPGGSTSSNPSAAWPVDAKTGLRAPELGPVPALPVWADNPVTDAKIALGNAMFNDTRLSGSGATTCGACHLQTANFQSNTPKDTPDRSYPALSPTLPRNTPSLNNIVYAPMARWDGSYFINTFNIAVLPLAEANMNVAHVLPASDVEDVDLSDAQTALYHTFTVTAPGYVSSFQAAFGQDITTMAPADVWGLAGYAMAAYLRVAVSRDSAFDRWNAGDDTAMSAAAIRGFALFHGDGRCELCHAGPLFSDFQFHNVSTSAPAADGTRPDNGRYIVTDDPADLGAFLTPTLRSASMTSPYLHDGSETAIAAVITRLSTPSVRDLDPNHDTTLDLIPQLTSAQISDLVAFVEALRGADIPLAALAPPATLP